MRKLNKNNGITIISLIVTVIIMLILAGVTITMLKEDKIVDYAEKAVGDTQNAINQEQELINKVGEYLKNKTSGNLGTESKAVHNWTRETGENIDTFKCSHCNTTYTMGDIVDYTPNGKTSTTIEPCKLEDSGDEEQLVERKNAIWVILGIEDTDKDGINETLLITTDDSLGTEDTDGITLSGRNGFNNGASEINRICKELYSNSEYGEARGMTIEDVNRTFNYTPLGGEYCRTDYEGDEWFTTGNFTTKVKDLPIWEDIKENGTMTPDGQNTEGALGEYILNGYSCELNEDKTGLINNINEEVHLITEKEKNIIFGENATYTYWLASQLIKAQKDKDGTYAEVRFDLFDIYCYGRIADGPFLMTSEMWVDDEDGSIDYISDHREQEYRPVVSLKSKLPSVIDK